MKRFLLLLLIIALVASVVSYRRNTDIRSAVAQFSEADLDAGKHARYRLYLFGVLPVGEAVFFAAQYTQFKDAPAYHLSLAAQSTKDLSWLYVAEFRADSYVRPETFLPEAFVQKVDVKGKKAFERGVVYAQDDQTMSVEGEKRTIHGDTHDPLSALFWMSRMRYEDLKDFELNINTNQKDYLLVGRAQRSDELINRKARRIITVSADIQRRGNNPYHKSHLEMVLSGRKKNTPVLMKTFASGFLVISRLISLE